jgi:hypothetical protein
VERRMPLEFGAVTIQGLLHSPNETCTCKSSPKITPHLRNSMYSMIFIYIKWLFNLIHFQIGECTKTTVVTLNVFIVSHRTISSLNSIIALSLALLLQTEGGHEYAQGPDSQQVSCFCSKVVYLPFCNVS